MTAHLKEHVHQHLRRRNGEIIVKRAPYTQSTMLFVGAKLVALARHVSCKHEPSYRHNGRSDGDDIQRTSAFVTEKIAQCDNCDPTEPNINEVSKLTSAISIQ
jgi:hypothetical protein